jgi:hypothetical protein
MSAINIDWNVIRPLNGSRANGFEELCAQLAHAEIPAGARFERKGAPDAGVECYAILSDGSEWGWQAKYFDTFGDSQWSQLDDSVKTAHEKHPRLVRYFICVPLNRADARIEGRRSAKDRWDTHVQKWTDWASARGMPVEVIYWRSHELVERLACPQHVGRVRFWFDVRGFDGAWFTARLDEAIKAAGPRYTPEVHVDLPIAVELDAFGRTEQFFDRIKTHARDIRKRLQSFQHSASQAVDPELDTSASALSSQVQGVLTELGAVTVQPIGLLPFQRIAAQVATLEAAGDELKRLLFEREREHDARPPAAGERWLPLSKAEQIVNALLPGREFERSLYRGLVLEGVLMEETAWRQDAIGEESVFVAYDRFADHLMAKTLLDAYLDADAPASAFAAGCPLAFLCDENVYIAPGLLEAMCIQIPERTGQELVSLAPQVVKHWGMGEAFCQSLIWRRPDAFPPNIGEVLNRLIRTEHELDQALDAILTVATLPEHPLNAQFLHQRLRRDSMPERDAWWSVYLHHAWGNHGAVDRLVDWASSVTPSVALDDETVDLCATTLAWMLTTSNRFLRDRTTKALVSLLTGRLSSVVRLVERFADVDDLYVAERIYAVAYGTGMRSHNPAEVGALAAGVYAHVFASRAPPAHILLRDYARGVVERALYLGADLQVDETHIRPPYKSQWPAIPTKDTQQEDSVDAELQELVEAEEPDRNLTRAEREREAALEALESVLIDEHARALEQVLNAMSNNDEGSRPPRFDLRLIQRYVLWRVFDLGWTAARFGYFDRYSIRYHGREASKAERIGKKYQWIAYHEIMALVADHFQYRERFHEEQGDQAYVGPWQGHLRDIDPSCTFRATRGGTSWEGHTPAWWGAARYENWGGPSSPREWVIRCNDLPKVEDLLRISDPENASRWLNLEGFFYWKQPPPADRESIDVERRELWYLCTGYLVRTYDAEAFMRWAEGVDFWGRWMPEPPEVYRMFLGEQGWSSASRYFQQPYYGDEGWTQPDHGCPVKVRTLAFEYRCEASDFDCSIDEGYMLRLPASELVTGRGLRWSGNGADYLDVAGQLSAFDPTAYEAGPSALLLREDLLKEILSREGLTICWAVLGEKCVLGAGFDPRHHASLRMSGAYRLGDKGPVGFLKCMLDERETESREASPNLLTTIRSPG